MADSQDESDSVGDPTDDGQLTIRIPNPKVYMARQSQWIGRRGKPRCDHCRLNNLKCDRVLPACNHCSWASGRECKYTPLPTPAHRGIPRCDRCRLKNLKCDRNLPVCNHCSEDQELECNYTPKKRHKVPSDHGPVKDSHSGSYGTKSASFLVSEMSSMEDQDMDSVNDNDDYADQRHSFYGQNIASTSSHTFGTASPNLYDREGSSEQDVPRFPKTGRFTPDRQGRVWLRQTPLPQTTPKPPPTTTQISFISHTFPPDQGMVISKSHIEPWSYPAFPPLPEVVIRCLNNVDLVEMPGRNAFDESFGEFLAELGPELRETAAFMPEDYILIHRCIIADDLSRLPERTRMWLSYHHVCSGSNKQFLLLVPRDDFFHIGAVEKEKLRAAYIARMDGRAECTDWASPHSHNKLNDSTQHEVDPSHVIFERLPTQPQIYDILVYAHRTHISSLSMLPEIRKLGIATITWPMAEIFVRLCPLCSLRGKQAQCHGVKSEMPASLFGTIDIKR